MQIPKNIPQKMILDLGKLNALNTRGYAGKFCLGDTVVLACGAWSDGPRWLLEHEAVLDRRTGTYFERRCFKARQAAQVDAQVETH
jgi:hypothetical protein